MYVPPVAGSIIRQSNHCPYRCVLLQRQGEQCLTYLQGQYVCVLVRAASHRRPVNLEPGHDSERQRLERSRSTTTRTDTRGREKKR